MFTRQLDAADGQRRQHAEDLFLLGRALVKSGDREQARLVLNRALAEDRGLSDAWLWLAATTEDPAEQKQHLDWAIATNPGNTAARRWLALLNGQLRPALARPAEGAPELAAASVIQTVTAVRTFTCRKCGGALRFDPELAELKCAQCSTLEVIVDAPAGGEKLLDAVLPTPEGHAWAEAQRRQVCQQCGAVTIFPPGQTSTQCPFCGAMAFGVAPEEATLLPPQCLLPIKVDAAQAAAQLKSWLSQGFFAPDDLIALTRQPSLRPAYLPGWIFDFDVAVHWQALVSSGTGRSQTWEWRKDQRVFFFKNFVQPGVRSLSLRHFRRLEPFDWSALVDYKPDYLAGWPAAMYDLSLADATLEARGQMAQSADQQIRFKAAPGRSLRNFQITGHDFTGQTYRLALLPLWLGTYTYGGKLFHVLVNGQTGKVSGDKPVDQVKVAAVAVGAFFTLLLLAVLAIFMLRGLK